MEDAKVLTSQESKLLGPLYFLNIFLEWSYVQLASLCVLKMLDLVKIVIWIQKIIIFWYVKIYFLCTFRSINVVGLIE